MTKTERIAALEERLAAAEQRIADLEACPRYYWPQPYQPYQPYTSYPIYPSWYTTSTSDDTAPTWKAQPNLDLSDIANNLEYKYERPKNDGISA